jgi:hypothetical protein
VSFRTLLLGHHDDNTGARITDALDRMGHHGRLEVVRAAKPKDQAALWELFEDCPIEPDDLVPSDVEPMTEVIHEGKNTLPAHQLFQKRFVRTEDDADRLYGYNHQGLSWATGPGYFVAHSFEGENEPSPYAIDYREIPPAKPDAWPKIQPNEKGLGRFVYAGMIDYLRKVSDHVLIGRAYKGGKPMNAYFLLCREEPAEE